MTASDEETKIRKSWKTSITPRRAGWLALNVLLPVSEVSGLARYTGKNVSRLWQRIREVTAGAPREGHPPVDWAQAVTATGLSAERLARNFRISRWFWWVMMWLTGLPATGFLVMLFAAGSSISGTGWLRVGCTLLVLFLLSATGFVQTLAVNFRLWQLTEKRVSESEKGCFRDFLQETNWCRNTLNGGLF